MNSKYHVNTFSFLWVIIIFALSFAVPFANATTVWMWVDDAPVAGDGNHDIRIDSGLWRFIAQDWSYPRLTLTEHYIALGSSQSVESYSYSSSGEPTLIPLTDRSPGTYSYSLVVCAEEETGGEECIDYTSDARYNTATVTQEIPDTPIINNMTSPNTNGAYSVSWSSIAGADTYELSEKVGTGLWEYNKYNLTGLTRAFTGQNESIYTYQVRACNYAGCSAYSATKSVTVAFPAPVVVNLPYSESFESGLGDWVNTSDKSWTRDSAGTPSGSTGPSLADDGTYYMFMETSSGHAYASGDTASLASPTFNATDASITFSYHMYGSDMGSLYLEIYSNNQWKTIWNRSGQQHSSSAAPWLTANVSLDDYIGLVQLRFRGVAAGDYRGDMAIDHIVLAYNLLIPTGMSAEYSASSHGLKISWSDVENTQHYEVARSVDGGTNWVTRYSGVTTNFVDTDIGDHPGAIYYRVRACSSLCSPWSTTPAAQ